MWPSNALISYFVWIVALGGYGEAASGFVNFLVVFED